MNEQSAPSPFCSEISAELAEPLLGTVTPTSSYLLLEYNGAPGAKAIEESAVPDELKLKIKGFTKANPRCKALLIRSHRSLFQPGIRFFVARSESPTALYDFRFSDYEDLLGLDFQAVLDGAREYERNRRDTPLYVVCTNGKRDRCCARFGPAVFSEIIKATQDDPSIDAWQCSHVGGHRFAANLIYLPFGIWYGRMRPEHIPDLLEAHRAGKIYLPRLRGRAIYPPAVQAAEAALLASVDQNQLGNMRLSRADEHAPGEWDIEFDAGSGKKYIVRTTVRFDDRRVYESCTLDKTTPVPIYTFKFEES